MLKEFLSQRGIAYQNRDVSIDRAAGAEVVRLTGQMAVPVTVIDGQTVVGFDQPKLEHLLAQASGGPSLGAAVGDAARITKMRGLPPATGAFVGGVKPGSLARRLGLTVGDIITELNGQSVSGPDDIEKTIAGLRPGSGVSVSFKRGEQRLNASGTL
jgi:S1-C subfamily serine protease